MNFGLFLNTGEFPGMSHDAIYDLLLAKATLADDLGYHDLWITEHHFIPFGINSSALAAAAFLLGHTRRVRVGTAVVLSPQYHPVQLAEQAAILDQLSGGRFDLGIGRGGYLRDFEAFGTPLDRYDREVEGTIRSVLDAWDDRPLPNADRTEPSPPVTLNPRPLTRPRPPLFVASSSPASVALAARNRLPLLNYFATPAEARVKQQASYVEAGEMQGIDVSDVEHVHAVLCLVTDEPEAEARAHLLANVTHSYQTGDWPHVPQGANRHTGPDGSRPSPAQLAEMTVAAAMVGSPASVTEQLTRFIETTGARRIALFMEMAADSPVVLRSVHAFAEEVAPAIRERFPDAIAV